MIDPVGLATERVGAAAAAAHRDDDHIVLTARCESHLYGGTDLDDTIARLIAYRDAGADCLYAPGLTSIEDIGRLVDAVGAPVNVLARPNGPSVPELAAVGVRRVSTGGALASTAYGALMVGADELRDTGTSGYIATHLRAGDRAALSTSPVGD